MNCRTQQLYNPGLEARLCFPLTVCKWSCCKMMLATIPLKYRECSTIKFEIKPFVTTSLQGVVSRLSRDLSGNVLFESLYCLYVFCVPTVPIIICTVRVTPHKIRACHGWSRCSRICLISVTDIKEYIGMYTRP